MSFECSCNGAQTLTCIQVRNIIFKVKKIGGGVYHKEKKRFWFYSYGSVLKKKCNRVFFCLTASKNEGKQAKNKVDFDCVCI